MPEARSLLQRVAQGDSDAVQLVLDRHSGLVWSIARRQLDPSDAEDLVQTVFIDLWRHADRYDPARGSEATFIAVLTRRRLIDHLRRRGRIPEHEDLDQIGDRLPDSGDDTDLVEVADEARVASKALAELRPEQRRVLRLSIAEGLSHTEIAEATGLPLGTVKSHVRRGLTRVRELLRAGPDSSGPRDRRGLPPSSPPPVHDEGGGTRPPRGDS